MAFLREFSSPDQGESVYVAATGRYKIFSADKFNYVILDVFANGPPSASDTMEIYGGSEIQDDVMHLSRIVYSSEFGFILGGPSEVGGYGIPLVIDKRTTGTVDDTIISENILERYIQGPRNELRGSGIIRDLDIKDITPHTIGSGMCRIDVFPGVGVINGVRVEYLGINDLYYNYEEPPTDNFYIAIDGRGCLLVAPQMMVDGDYTSPFFNQNVAHIAYVEIDDTWATDPVVTDLRLFVDHLDYKVVADITVANDQRFGHFTDIKKAVDYARKFTKMFPGMGRPSIFIKEGVHEISEAIWLNFDVRVHGSGPQTVIKRAESFLLDLDNITYANWRSSMFLISSETDPSEVEYGVTFENLTLVGTEGQAGQSKFGTAIQVRHNVSSGIHSPTAMFAFNNLRFIAASDYSVGSGPSNGGPNQQPFRIGSGIGKTYQNVIISNCYFDGMGYEQGVIYLDADNTYNNISVLNCISVNTLDSAGGHSLVLSGGGNTLNNVNEVGCMIVDL